MLHASKLQKRIADSSFGQTEYMGRVKEITWVLSVFNFVLLAVAR